jgi:hypothetical protein
MKIVRLSDYEPSRYEEISSGVSFVFLDYPNKGLCFKLEAGCHASLERGTLFVGNRRDATNGRCTSFDGLPVKVVNGHFTETKGVRV